MPKINDNGVDRDMTPEEAAAYMTWSEQHQATVEENELAQAAKAAARTSALAKLGLTADEVAALFG